MLCPNVYVLGSTRDSERGPLGLHGYLSCDRGLGNIDKACKIKEIILHFSTIYVTSLLQA